MWLIVKSLFSFRYYILSPATIHFSLCMLRFWFDLVVLLHRGFHSLFESTPNPVTDLRLCSCETDRLLIYWFSFHPEQIALWNAQCNTGLACVGFDRIDTVFSPEVSTGAVALTKCDIKRLWNYIGSPIFRRHYKWLINKCDCSYWRHCQHT